MNLKIKMFGKSMFRVILLLFIPFSIYAFSVELDQTDATHDLLGSSQIYIDTTQSLSMSNIIEKNVSFKKNSKKSLSYGYAPDFDVWIKFTLNNTTAESIQKIIEYDNPLTTDIVFFSPKDNYMKEEGLFHIDKNRKTVNPIFHVKLKSGESKTFYIKASSHITTLIIKLKLWSESSFYVKEIKHQLILALFFGAMLILAVYNLFIYFFTKDLSYLYYVLYIFGIVAHQLIYVGLANIYFLNQTWRVYFIEYASLLVVLPALALALFTRSFLQTKQYPRLNKVLNIVVLIVIVASIVVIFTDILDKYRSLFPALLLLLLMFVSFYSAYKKNPQAYFIVFAWIVFLAVGMFMYLSSAGLFSIFNYFPYYVEISLVTEAIIFSIALAYRIRQLQKDKIEANQRLIAQQQNETKKLEQKVSEKTKDLESAFRDKEVLLKELNHRVKNNMQMIVSLIRLQVDETQDKNFREMLLTIQNRINAMSHLHELLYFQNQIGDVNAYDYFEALIDEIKESYDDSIKIDFDISTDLKIEQAVYCGLILNELITNAFKYAFISSKVGTIQVELSEDDGLYTLDVRDNGVGFTKVKSPHSLGLILVDSLVKKLNATMQIHSKNGVAIEIKWR